MTISTQVRKSVILMHLNGYTNPQISLNTGISISSVKRIVQYWFQTGIYQYMYPINGHISLSQPRTISYNAILLIYRCFQLKCTFYAKEIQRIIWQILLEWVSIPSIYRWAHRLGFSFKRCTPIARECNPVQILLFWWHIATGGPYQLNQLVWFDECYVCLLYTSPSPRDS